MKNYDLFYYGQARPSLELLLEPRRRWLRSISIFLFCCFNCFISGQVVAQTPQTPGAKGDLVLRGVIRSGLDSTFLYQATITVDGKSTQTNQNGEFVLQAPIGSKSFQVRYMGYRDTLVDVNFNNAEIYLQPLSHIIREIEVVSTGYQRVHPERLVGSAVQVDNELLRRRVSTDVLSQIEDVVPGLIFNRNNPVSGAPTSASSISIRGQSTIMGNADPLIVIDNFPYEGDIRDINPNDVESVSVLKDASAASIWGTRAGNGVIVITTKKGSYAKSPKISFFTNGTLGAKPDLFYQPRMSTSDFIDVERMLFSKGYYAAAEYSLTNEALTPVVELLIAERDGLISSDEATRRINDYKQIDYRNQVVEYFYRPSRNIQSALNITGGSNHLRYFLSGGFDNNQQSLINTGFRRISLNANQTLSLLSSRLEIGSAIYFAQTNEPLSTMGFNEGWNTPYYPYARFVDDEGNALPVTHGFRKGFIEQAENSGLMSWQYIPLEEFEHIDHSKSGRNYRININTDFKLTNYLSASIFYHYSGAEALERQHQSSKTYYTRNLINSFTEIGGGEKLIYNLPPGGILDLTTGALTNQNLRAQLNINKNWSNSHRLEGIAGYEFRNQHSIENKVRRYGYNNDLGTFSPVSYLIPYPQYYSIFGATATIPFADFERELVDRFRSFYSNFTYTLQDKYILNASARLDQSNIFGVNTNAKGVPLYSIGLGWNIHRERFFNDRLFSTLKLRLSYGYNGNVYKDISSMTTARAETYYSYPINSGLPYSEIVNPPYPDLRWEKVGVANVGIDFILKNQRIKGTLDIFQKMGVDLIGPMFMDPTTGVTSFTSNNASTQSFGADLSLTTKNLLGELQWQTDLLLSHFRDRVLSYQFMSQENGFVNVGYPIEGKPLYALHSYAWAGLNPQTGKPIGILNGEPTENYLQIINSSKASDLIYNGSLRPTWFGSIRNSFRWRDFAISANITYRLAYSFRKNSVNYNRVLRAMGGHGDYALRWQRPGDEAHTFVPSLPEMEGDPSTTFYLSSDVLSRPADHIRFQDVRIDYNLNKEKCVALPFNNIGIYLYANNLGVIWAANQEGIDPDFQTQPLPKTISLGINLNF